MTARVLRVGDIVHGTCNAHTNPVHFTGTFTTGSTICTVGGLGVVRVGDTGTTDCGHHIQATIGSAVGQADGKALHRVGDTGIVIEGGTYVADTDTNCILTTG